MIAVAVMFRRNMRSGPEFGIAVSKENEPQLWQLDVIIDSEGKVVEKVWNCTTQWWKGLMKVNTEGR